MTIQDIVNIINKKMYEGLLTYDDIKYELNEAIDFINEYMFSDFPDFTDVIDESDGAPALTEQSYSDEEDDPIFPDKYLRQVVIPHVVAAMFKVEGEFESEYQAAMRQAHNGISIMFRDYYPHMPDKYVRDDVSGIISMDEDIVADEVDETSDSIIDWSLNYDGDV